MSMMNSLNDDRKNMYVNRILLKSTIISKTQHFFFCSLYCDDKNRFLLKKKKKR